MTQSDPDSDLNFNLAHFFDLSGDLLCIAGFDGYFKRINPAVSKTLGYSNAELLARPIDEFVFKEDRSLTKQSRDNVINGIPLLNFENRYVTRTGEIVWLSWTSMPVDGEQLIYAVAKNITHKKQLEADRNALLAHLTQINFELKQISYTTSHDLRAPVNNLLSVFQLLDLTKIHDPETLQLIEILQSTTDVLKQNLNQQVDVLNRQPELNVQVEELSLEQCLDEILLALNALVHQSRTRIHRDFSAFETVCFNKSRLNSIFLNLISNAIKYARLDLDPEIRISTRIINGVRQLVFSDNGRGFDMDQVKDLVFGLNQSFHDHADSKGIGLYLVYNHITSLGGQIALESQINQGTSFIISFKAES
ncbi:MAG: PAS domain-containing sensor histidine kinase [Candidatus Melainabacteria bacterium HGW-Melainabacteria-1]|nr:MAG: PAS domain-containing sensor histidine kinase [Candidatus Melainabacteria bacterium HGW-Melainabacteria-1]